MKAFSQNKEIFEVSNMDSYKITIAGLERDLPICSVSDTLDIAAFVMFGDIEITEAVAAALLAKCPEHDIVVTAEAKGIPLCYEMARQGCRDYEIARKSIKTYDIDPISFEVKSITTNAVQRLYLAKERAERLKGKRVLIVDDVISTGASLYVLEELVKQAGGIIVGKAAVLAEGDAAQRDDIIFLEQLPLFPK